MIRSPVTSARARTSSSRCCDVWRVEQPLPRRSGLLGMDQARPPEGECLTGGEGGAADESTGVGRQFHENLLIWTFFLTVDPASHEAAGLTVILRPKDRSYAIDETLDGLAADLRHHPLGQLGRSLRAPPPAFASRATIRVRSQT